MITKINKIKNFGIYKNFSWGDLIDFKKENLLYGWNYSGKTTLSKLFQNLEFQDKEKYFPGSEFELTIDLDGNISTYNHNNLKDFPFIVKVFNSNFIHRVFTFDTSNSDFNPISFYLGDPSGELDKKIKHLEKKNSQLEKIKNLRCQPVIDEFEAYHKNNGKFSAKAKEIRENYLDNKFDQNKLNKGILKRIAENIKADLTSHILSDIERDKAKSEALAENTFDEQQEDFSFSQNIKTLTQQVKEILEDTAPKSLTFANLDNDTALFKWVQQGLSLHEDETECQFCTTTLPENRIQDLNSYYSKKLKEIQSAIESASIAISEEKERLKIPFPNEKNLGKSFQKSYSIAISNYQDVAKKYDKQLSILLKDLKGKSSDYFNSIPATKIEIVSLDHAFEEIKSSLKSHNDWLSKFDQNKKIATTKILNHFVAKFLLEEDYNHKELNHGKAIKTIEEIERRKSANSNEKTNLEASLKSFVKGQKELNDILKTLLHRDDIKIEIKNDKFTLERGGYPANNLSEGEKSAIAFAYFLTELKAFKEDVPSKLSKSIVFIDDPISSLDSNHIFQVRSLISNFFKESEFAQLFISTHNFEFFSVILDTNLFGHKNKDSKGKNKRPLYFIKRNDNNTSELKKLPLSFSSYKSEYVGLFHTINDFNETENKEDFPNILILPNAVRRFLELYTLMKYPSDKEVDHRVKKIFNPEDHPSHNTKLLHWFSHQNQFEKIQQHDDKILQLEGAVKELLEHIKTNDDLHWKGLIGE